MLSRISDALGCPLSKNKSSTSTSEDSSWLSASVESVPYFLIPTPFLQDMLQKIGVVRCPNTGHFRLVPVPFVPTAVSRSESNTPWSIAHSAQKRCKHLDFLLKSKQTACSKILQELRSLALASNENNSDLPSFAHLLCPLLTDFSDSETDAQADDVLLLFGSPATTFQILLFTHSLRPLLTDLILELVATRSIFSAKLLEQFKQPVGLSALLDSKQDFADTSSRLLELFQIVMDANVQAKILGVLPDLASAPCSTGNILCDEDRSLLVLQLIDLLGTISLRPHDACQNDLNPVICLIECLSNFSMHGELVDRLISAFFNLLDRCHDDKFYYQYLPIITRCLLINGPTVPQTPVVLSRVVGRLRAYFKFPTREMGNGSENINSCLVDLIRIAFQFNRNITTEWMHAISASVQSSDTPIEDNFRRANQEQATQDFIILCVALSTPTMTILKGDNISAEGAGETLYSSDSFYYKRLASEVISIIRRLIKFGRLFSFDNLKDSVNNLFVNYGDMLMCERNRLFPSFLYILHQLVIGGSCFKSNLISLNRHVGLLMYMKGFCYPLNNSLHKQEILGHLIRHVLVGLNSSSVQMIRHTKFEGIASGALIALLRLSQSNARDLVNFTSNFFCLQERLMVYENSRGLDRLKADTNTLIRKENVRLIFSVLGYKAFDIREHRKLQDDLLGFIRQLLTDDCAFSKCLGIIGVVVLLEVISRSGYHQKQSMVHVPADENESIVLASQLAHVDEDRASTSTLNTSRSSNTSCLSLKGPGTGMADDPNEVHLVDEIDEERGADCSVGSSRHITPPSRLLLQLVGLVEHAISPYPQLMVFWLDELAYSFARFAQINRKSGALNLSVPDQESFSTPNTCSVQRERLLSWMGARIMRDFTDDFVLDNISNNDFCTQFSLHDCNICEIALAIGPTWYKFCAHKSDQRKQNNYRGVSSHKLVRICNPFLMPAQLHLLAVVEAHRNGGHLDAINALLGCPVLLPGEFSSKELLNLCGKNKTIRIQEPHLVLFMVNWFIEAVNVFAPKLFVSGISTIDFTSPSNPSSSKKIQHISVLLRLTQIANLRKCLYSYIVNKINQNSPLNLKLSDDHICSNDNLQHSNSVFQQASQINKQKSAFIESCLPTYTYQPNACFNHHISENVNTYESQFGFTSGINLLQDEISQFFGKKRKFFGHGNSSKYSSQSKDKEVPIVDKSTASRMKRQKSSSDSMSNQAVEAEMNEDSNISEDITSDSSHETEIPENILLTDSQKSKKTLCGKASKLTGNNRMKCKSSESCPLTPSLSELSACFRELDLNVILIGLSSWPWRVKFVDEVVTNSKSNCSLSIDWTTLSWLLDEFIMRLDNLVLTSSPDLCGWNAFERLNNLSESVRSKYLIYSIPHIHRAFMLASSFCGDNENDDNLHDTSLSSLSSNEEVIVSSSNPNLQCQNSPRLDSNKNIINTIHGIGYFVSSALCNSLLSILILANSLTKLSTSVDKFLFNNSTSHGLESVTDLGLQCIYSLAKSCESKPFSYHQELLISSKGTIDPNAIEMNDSTDIDMNIKHHILNEPYFYDVFDENEDIATIKKEISTIILDPVEMSDKLKTILNSLIQISPKCLPHATAALFHCRLTFYLTSLYYCCQHKMTDSFSNVWTPNLLSYTKDFLNHDWNTSIKYKGHTYRESLQGLLAFHLRCQFYQNKNDGNFSHLTELLTDFVRRLIVPTICRYQHISDQSNSSEHTNESGYKTLTSETADLYCREVLETVIWLCKHLCLCVSSNSLNANRVTLDESSIIAQWNQCVEIICLIINLLQKSMQLSKINSSKGKSFTVLKRSNILLHLLPTMMRTGRLFLQSLLKGAMPLLNNLFRHRGVEVTTFLRNTQQLTRFLQRVCTHAKAYRDSQLTNQIPSTRRCLETFVYRVKILLSQNQCAEAFWLGTLKNRDLHGIELPDDEDDDSVHTTVTTITTDEPSSSYQGASYCSEEYSESINEINGNNNSSVVSRQRKSCLSKISNKSCRSSNRLRNIKADDKNMNIEGEERDYTEANVNGSDESDADVHFDNNDEEEEEQDDDEGNVEVNSDLIEPSDEEEY